MNTVKRPSRATTKDDKGQEDLKGVTKDESSTKEGSTMKMITTRVNEQYGGSDGKNGLGGSNGRAQNGETK